MKYLKYVLGLMLLLPNLVTADTPPQVINKTCAANQYFNKIAPGAGNITCAQPSYSGLTGLPAFINSLQLIAGNVSLVGDTATPGNTKYYGTDGSGNLGYYSLTGSSSVGVIDTQVASANGAVITGGALYMQSASATRPGLVNNTTQTLSGSKTFSAAPSFSSIVNSGTLTLPTSSDTLVGRATTDTLTNKTLTSPIISTISNSGTLTLPTSTDTLVGRATTDTLTNKTLTAPVISTISNSGVLTLPTTSDTLVGRATTDTLTNKTLTLPVISSISNSGTVTIPSGVETLVGRATSDTLTNKTLTAPVISSIVNSGTLTLPTSTDTILGRATTDTLTNKSISGSSNTLTNIADGSLTTSYLKADGTRALTGNWGAGAFSGTFNSVAVGSAANTISQARVISSDSTMGLQTASTNRAFIDAAGLIGLANPTTNASDEVNIGGGLVGNNGATTVTQRGLDINHVSTSAATTSTVGLQVGSTTDAQSYTSVNRYQIRTLNNALGAGSSVTHDQGINIVVPTRGGTSNAAISDTVAPTAGSYFIYSASTNPSVLSGQLEEANGSASAPSFTNSTGKTGEYFSGESMLFSANQSSVGNYSSAGLWTLGASGGTQQHVIQGAGLTGTGASASTFKILRSVTDGSLNLSGSTATGSGGQIDLFGSTHATQANTIFMATGGTNGFVMDANQLITIGASGGTQAHVVNGELKISSGSASAPAYSNSTGKTGMYFSGETIRFAANQIGVANVNATGHWGFGSLAAQAGKVLSIDGTVPLAADVTGAGFYDQTSAPPSFAGNAYIGFDADGTVSAGTTIANLIGFETSDRAVGAGGVITRKIGFGGVNLSVGVNNAIFTDNSSFSGNYFLNQSSSYSNKLLGILGVGANSADTALYIAPGSLGSALSTTTNYGVLVDGAQSSSATAAFYSHFGNATTSNSSYTLTDLVQFYAANPAKGAASTITNQIQYGGVQPTRGTNNSFLTDTLSPTGSTFIYQSGTSDSVLGGNIEINTAGKGFQIKEGSNARLGTCTLVLGTCTVSNTSVTSSTRIFLTAQSLGTVAVPKAIAVTARVASTSFVITSADATDTSVIAWEMVEPL